MNQIRIDKVIDLLHKRTHTLLLRTALEKIWNVPGQKIKIYFDRDAEAKKLVPGIYSVLSKYQPDIDKKHALGLAWFLLMLPLEVERIESFNFKPIFLFIEDIFKTLIQEALAVKILDQSQARNAHKCLRESALVILHKYQNNPLPKYNGAVTFYEDAILFDTIDHFALACPAFFNWRVAKRLENEIKLCFSIEENRMNPSDMNLWVPFRCMEEAPYSMMRRGIEGVEMRSEEEYLLPEDFVGALENSLVGNKLMHTTLLQHEYEFLIFMKATLGHKTIWICPEFMGEQEEMDCISAFEDEA